MTKKYSTFFIALLILLQTVGLYHLSNIQHPFFKQKSQHKANSKLIETVSISIAQYNTAVLDDKEISLNDELYDIISAEFKNNTVVLKLYKDTDEKNFTVKIKNLIKKQQSKKNKSVLKSKILLSYSKPTKYNLHQLQHFNNLLEVNYSRKKIKDVFISIQSPPPELI